MVRASDFKYLKHHIYFHSLFIHYVFIFDGFAIFATGFSPRRYTKTKVLEYMKRFGSRSAICISYAILFETNTNHIGTANNSVPLEGS